MATLFLLTVPSALILFIATSTIQERLERQTFSELDVWASVFSRQISEEFGALSRYVESFASRPSLAGAAAAKDLEDLEKQLTALVDNNDKISRGVFVSTNGTLLTAHPSDPSVLGRNFGDRDWFRGASRSNSAYVSEVYRRSAFGEEIVVTIGCAVRDNTGKPLGLIGAQYLIRDLNAWIDRLLKHTPQEVVIADQNGRAIRDKRNVLDHLAKPFSIPSKLNQSDSQPSNLKVPLAEDVHFVSKLALTGPPWTVYLLKAQTIAMLHVREIRTVILTFFALSVVLFLAVGLIWIRTLFRYAHGFERSNRHLEYFCYSIAHNFRAPLRTFTGFTDILLTEKSGQLDSEAKDYVQKISSSALLMNSLVNDLLAFGRISHAEINVEKLEIEAVIRSALQDLQEEIQTSSAKVNIVGAFDGVLADRILLQRILKELICNAIRFVPASTLPEIRIQTETDGNCVRLWVHDNGVGIDPRYQDQVFEIFHKLETRGAGTGVGLAIAKNAAERLGGSIGVKSAPGQGSSFWVDLPRG